MSNRYGKVNADVVLDPGLSQGAVAVYCALAVHAKQDRTCFPSITRIAELRGVSRRTVERCLKELEEKNYVTRTGRTFTIK